MKQYNYLVVFAHAPFGIGSAHITRTSKLDNFEKIVELANWIGNKNNIKDVAIISFQLVGISRVKKENKK
jgi:hypothetical protein